MLQDITVTDFIELLSKREVTPVDVRSPSEYLDGTIPGSVNIPLFDDEERAEIGTLYKQTGKQAAMDRGLDLVSAKLPKLLRDIREIDGQKVVFCWRGGMRSKTTATMLSLMGVRAYRLHGGIREYRRWVLESLERFELKPRTIVINGLTGSGKTLILQKLQEKGYPVLDLESMAGHRGSAFGGIGLKARNQKQFDSALIQELIKLNQAPYLLVEGESKRIGKVAVPDFLMKAKEEGLQLYIEIPIEERVRHIISDYQPETFKEEAEVSFKLIKSRIHTPVAKEIEQGFASGDFEQVVRLLLQYYYDPRYSHAINSYEAERKVIQADSIEDALRSVVAFLDAYSKNEAMHIQSEESD